MTDLEKLKIVLDSKYYERDTILNVIPGRSLHFSSYSNTPVPYVLKSFILRCIEEIEQGKWPLYIE